MKQQINQKRRDFLKNSSLSMAGVAMTGGSLTASPLQAKESTESRTVVTAAHWGPLGVVIENGKVVKSGAAIPASIENELQSVVAEQLYSEVRVKYPMVRKGYLEGNTDRTLRGRDEWVRVSWETFS